MGLKDFFIKIIENLSHVSKDDVARFTTKSLGDIIPVIGPIIKNAAEEFYPDKTDLLLEELKDVTNNEIKALSKEIGIQTTEVSALIGYSLYHFQNIKEDHIKLIDTTEKIHNLLLNLMKEQNYTITSKGALNQDSQNRKKLKEILRLLRRFVDNWNYTKDGQHVPVIETYILLYNYIDKNKYDLEDFGYTEIYSKLVLIYDKMRKKEPPRNWGMGWPHIDEFRSLMDELEEMCIQLIELIRKLF